MLSIMFLFGFKDAAMCNGVTPSFILKLIFMPRFTIALIISGESEIFAALINVDFNNFVFSFLSIILFLGLKIYLSSSILLFKIMDSIVRLKF